MRAVRDKATLSSSCPHVEVSFNMTPEAGSSAIIYMQLSKWMKRVCYTNVQLSDIHQMIYNV